MKTFFPLRLLCFVFVLSGCASLPTPGDTSLIGTWRWVSVDGQRVPEPFYVRYYPDGRAASWPAPKSWSDPQGVSRGRYSVANGFLALETGSGADNPKTRFQIEGDRMTLTTDEGHKLVYRRLAAPVEPGKLENGSPAGFAKHS